MLYPKDGCVGFDSERCMRCGACLPVCPTEALRLVESRDGFDIGVDCGKCIGCLKCVRVCPAAKMPELPLTEADFENLKRAVLAHATDPVLRLEGSSGGIARALAKAALSAGWVDAVYCAVKAKETPFAEGAFLTSPEEIERISNSVYCVFPFDKNLRMKLGERRISRLLLIGTNCQLLGAEHFYRGSKVELIKLAIICKQQKTPAYLQWARRKLKQPPGETAPIRFRGDGWPGVMSSGAARYKDYFRPFSMELWRVPGCRFCPNAWGSGSDILLADPWGLVRTDSGNPGLTMTLLRTEAGMALWEKASPSIVEESLLTAADVQKSMEWRRYQAKQAMIPFYLGREPSAWRRFLYRAAEAQRAFYGWLLASFPVPDIVEKVLNRTLLK